MTRYNFYNNLELFHKTKEIIQQEEQEKIQEDLNELKHYGTKGQKWGVRKWQNYDGTFNEAGKERYFGKSSKTTESDEDKVGSARSDVKDYLKFRNKMLKQRTRDDLNKWYRDNNKAADKQLLKDAKRVDKQREKMYKNQLKDFYDDPNELVSDLDRMYKIGSKDQKIGSTRPSKNGGWYNTDYQNEDGTLTKKGEKLLKRYTKHPNFWNITNVIDVDAYNKATGNNARDFKKEAEVAEKEKLMNNLKELDNSIKVTHELKGKDITDEEFDKITKDSFVDVEDLSQEDYDEIADLGLYRMKQNNSLDNDCEPGDKWSREWFMEEDQTDGYPQVVDFYRKGYSKDYVEKYLKKIKDMDLYDDEAEEIGISQWLNSAAYHPGSMIDDIYNDGSQDQKIGGLFDKTSEEKEAKKLAKEAKELEKEFTTTSKYDSSYKYLDSDKIDKWLDKEENKAVEKAYADTMETAFGDTSKELHKLFKDYDDNEDEYVAKAAICDSLDYYDNLGDISSEVRWFIGDDGDQGSRNSHAYYLNEKGYNAKQINDKLADAEKAMNEGYEVGKKLSQYYNPIIPHMPDDLQKKVYNQIHYRWEKSDDYSYNKLLNASEGLDFDKNNMKTADNFAKNLKSSCGNDWNGWMYFNKAVDNLGMNNTSYKDLSQADWDRINDEINKLKK